MSRPSAAAHESFLTGLDYSVVQQCMHCGLCLSVCPTYTATKEERHSPRGRIALMRAIADDELPVSLGFGEEMYYCLGCLACTSACPAGVNYAELFERARAEVERTSTLHSLQRRLIRWFTVKWLFMEHGRLQALGHLIRLYQELGLQTLLRQSGLLKLLPARLRELEAMTPAIQPFFSEDLIAPITPAEGTKRYRVALLIGCAQDLIFSDINRDTAEVLARHGCEVFTPSDQYCCGSLHAHNGELELARELARKNINRFPPEDFDAIISNAGGCGSHLKHYGHLLADDPRFRERAQLWDGKVKDIHEWLVEIGLQPPPHEPSIFFSLSPREAGREGAPRFMAGEQVRNAPGASRSAAPLRVTYHESCHLAHGQKITAAPRQVLRAIPNLILLELPESNWCCGSAGIYNIIQPEMAGQLLERKLNHIRSTGATVVATANPGCLLQILNGAVQRQMPLRIVHPVTLLAEAYRRGRAPAEHGNA